MNPEAHGHNTQRTSGSSEIWSSRSQDCCLLGYDDVWYDIGRFGGTCYFCHHKMYVFSDDGDSGFFLKSRSISTTTWGDSFPKADSFLMTETYNC